MFISATSFVRETPTYLNAANHGSAPPRTFFLFLVGVLCSVQILTPWREPPAPEKEAFMTFWLTRDALVHVCMDSRTPASKLPSWLEYAGFRNMPAS